MPTIPLLENDVEKQSYFRSLAEKSNENAIRFRIVERFLCEVDRWLLKPAAPDFDVAQIKEGIQVLRTTVPDTPASSLASAESGLHDEFYRWEQLIEKRDQGIETYNFRRFCDSSAEPLDNEIFVALAAFYKGRPYSHASQSKFDLVVTRLYTDIDRTGRRFPRFNAKEIAQHIEHALGDPDSEEDKSARFLDNAGAVTAIHSFIVEAQGLDDFESLIECRLFDRYREFKQELGKQFFEAMVVAAAIQCNVVFANAFNEMLETANENLSGILNSNIDIPAALHDASPGAQSHLSGLLEEFFDFTPDDRFLREGKVSDHIWELLSLAGAKGTDNGKHADPLTESPDFEFDTTRSARERLLPFLETLTKPEPDAGLLLGQLTRTRSLQNLNLSDFLYSEDHTADMRSRRILGLILWSEEFLQNELGRSTTLTPTAQQEVLSLIQKTEEFTTILRAEINAAAEASKSRLLVVQNSLLESRLRLEGAIVKFTNRNLSPVHEKDIPEHKAYTPAPVQKIEEVAPSKGSSIKWLLWLLLLAVVAAAAFYFYPKNDPDTSSDSSVTERIDASRLIDHVFISNAYGRGHTMFATARESWLDLPAEKQKETLKNLLEYQGITKFDNVVLRDATGHLLGTISAYGVHVPAETKSESNTKAN